MERAQIASGNPRKEPKQSRARVTVEAILEATAHILTEGGYDALTTNHVAKRAGVSIGSLYQYYPSKEALVGELMDRHCDMMNALFAEVFMRAEELPPKELARALVSAVFHAKCENPELSKVLREQLPRLGKLNRLEDSLAAITLTVASYLERHKEKLRISSIEHAAFYVVELGEHLTMATLVKRPHDDPEVTIDQITNVIVTYLFK